MVHAVVWIAEGVSKPPHGERFKRWAARANEMCKELDPITTCHNYEIEYKFYWVCSNERCKQMVGRHSKSLDTEKKRCGFCGGIFMLANKDGTPRKEKPLNGFALFVRENYARLKEGNSEMSHSKVMEALSTLYKQNK